MFHLQKEKPPFFCHTKLLYIFSLVSVFRNLFDDVIVQPELLKVTANIVYGYAT